MKGRALEIGIKYGGVGLYHVEERERVAKGISGRGHDTF